MKITIDDPDDLIDVKKSGGVGLIAALVLAVVLVGMAGSGGSDGSQDGLTARVAKAQAAARKGRYDEAWRLMQLRPVKRYVKSEREGIAYSYGQVRELLRHTPCRSLDRALLVVGTGRQSIAVSVVWVQMPDVTTATHLKQVVDKHGTGDVRPLPGNVLKLDDIRFTAKHYSSRRSRSMVVIAEAEPVAGHPAAALLDAVTQVAVELPPL